MSEPRRGLGRGLSALLGDVEREEPVAGGRGSTGVQSIPIAAIAPHPAQPRRTFDDAALNELAASIAARGLLQPIVVRPAGGDRYEIVAGERRWRAAQRAKLTEISALVRSLDDAATLEVSLLENIQRQDLNAIEEAEGYRRLIAEFGHTQEELGRLVHKSRSHVANLLRLLDLPEPVQAMLADGRLTMGHARALITAANPEALARSVLQRGLSVRETEALARGERPKRDCEPTAPRRASDDDIAALERQLGDLLGLRVAIRHSSGGGSVTLSYTSLDQLDMICQRLSGEPI